MTDVFDEIVGQERVVALLRAAGAEAPLLRGAAAVPGSGAGAMTHAWLITGPAGSGRSAAALAFAAALVCPHGGCGTCQSCLDVRHSTHDDVEHVVPEGVTYNTDEARELVRRSAMSATRSPWHVFVIEDADRLNEAAANALLKAIEEPPPGTVWILCAPSSEDVLPTISSRCRHLLLATPTNAEVAAALTEKFGVDPAMAAFAARAAQGHIGRARALATDEQARLRRADILRIPTSLGSLGDCFLVAADFATTVKEITAEICDPRDATERANLLAAYGQGGTGKGIGTVERRVKGPLKELETRQKQRRTRTTRDQLDRPITDLVAFYRDVLVLQLGAGSGLVNEEMRPTLERLAAESRPEQTLRRTAALERTRGLLEANVPHVLALESLMISLKDPSLTP
jgi:DNA polymerase-3 subunit delta'